MATSAQLQAESYWGRETVTPEIDWLGDELCRRTNRPRVAFGSKGNTAHLRGAHRSQEWIKRSRYCTNRTYTAQSGLTADQERHIAGVDFTPGEWGTARNRALMVEQTGRLMAAMKAGRLDEVIELFGTTNGRTVTGYNNRTNQAASSDDSHLDHWHLTIDRRHCRNKKLMERILAIALGLQTEDDDMTPEERTWLEKTAKMADQFLNPALGMSVGGTPTALHQVLRHMAWPLLNGPKGSGAFVGGWMTTMAEQAGISPAELEQISAAAREGAASAADELVGAVMGRLPVGQALNRADVEQAVRDAFSGGLAPGAAQG